MSKRTYRYFDGEALYPFGYGLGYTTFSYSHPRVDTSSKPEVGVAATISIDVTNTGAMAGDEVVQVYLTHPGISGAALRELKGFRRITLQANEKRTVSFTLNARDLSIVDETGQRKVMPGEVKVWIGGGQPVVRSGLAKPSGAETEFTITSESAVPD